MKCSATLTFEGAVFVFVGNTVDDFFLFRFTRAMTLMMTDVSRLGLRSVDAPIGL